MPFDYKKEHKEFYMPKNNPTIVTIPAMNFIAVQGVGDPNEEDGEYKAAIALLYAVAFTIKMSKKGDHKIEGYFDYVVPPLEGFWWQEGTTSIDYGRKQDFHWISLRRYRLWKITQRSRVIPSTSQKCDSTMKFISLMLEKQLPRN